jgi:hypothetical protein
MNICPRPSRNLPLRKIHNVLLIIQIPVLPVNDIGHHHPFGGGITAQLVCNDHAWSISSSPQQLPEET